MGVSRRSGSPCFWFGIMLFVNPGGRVVEIEEQLEIDRAIKRGFREPTDEEATAYQAERQQWLQEISKGDPDRLEIYYKTVRHTPDGYGMSNQLLKRELFKLGVGMNENYEEQKVGLLYNYPYGITQMENEVRLIYTMFESNSIPADWPDYLDAADEVIVPCKWLKDVFAKDGIEATVVPLGYNADVFKYAEREIPVEAAKDFVFVHYNAFNIRKGFSEVLEAFDEEFGDDEPVKMILKTTMPHQPIPLPRSQYPNIEVITGEVSEQGLVDILKRSNCMVYPSRGEGFGLTPLEAMATGIPAIVPNAHGISEYFNADYMLEVDVDGECPGLYNRFKGQYTGEMVVCSTDSLRKQMRYAYNHQKEMHELGKRASEYVKQYTYAKTAANLAEIFKKWNAADVLKRPDSKFLKVEKI